MNAVYFHEPEAERMNPRNRRWFVADSVSELALPRFHSNPLHSRYKEAGQTKTKGEIEKNNGPGKEAVQDPISSRICRLDCKSVF